ncbi:PTCHD2, partial [Symbiodinium necroappetens]
SWLTGMHSTKDYMWIRDGKVKASYMLMSVDFERYADTTSAIEYKKLWDKYLEEFNLDASIYTKGAWHTSSLWVRAEAQSALISSTILTIVIVVGLALLGMLVFTRDWKLSMLVVASTMLVVCILFWFIVVVMGWPPGPRLWHPERIGAIEVIALIVFIGYAWILLLKLISFALEQLWTLRGVALAHIL